MKSWKKRLNSELNEIVPSTPAFSQGSAPAARRSPSIKRWIWAPLSTVAAAAVVMSTVLPVVLNNGSSTLSGENLASQDTVVTVEINPAAAFVTDGAGKVTNLTALNADADVVLRNGNLVSSVKGKTLEETVTVYVDGAAKLGYLKMDGTDAVRVSSSSEYESKVTLAVEATKTYLKNKGVYAVVAKNSTTVEKFNAILGGVTIKDYIMNAEKSSPYFSEREANSLDEKDVKKNYDKLKYGEIKQEFKKLLKSHIASLETLAPDFADKLEEFVIDISDEDFDLSGEFIASLLSSVAAFDGKLEKLLTAPKTVKEYAEQALALCDIKGSVRVSENIKEYLKNREKISESAYEEFVNGVISEYGSENEYWEKHNSK